MNQTKSDSVKNLEALREQHKAALGVLKMETLEQHRKEAEELFHAQEGKHKAALEALRRDVLAEQRFESELALSAQKSKYEEEIAEVKATATRLNDEKTQRLLTEQEVIKEAHIKLLQCETKGSL